MQIKRIWFSIGLCSLALLASCAVSGHKFATPSPEQLEFGKLSPADAVAIFGKPPIQSTQTTPDGSYEVYKYTYAEGNMATIGSRVLLLEFKNGKLNGYYYWSSFGKDKTSVDLKNLDKLKAGMGKLSKDDVVALAGKPNAKALCPTLLIDLKDKCPNNTEVWGWFMANSYNPWFPQRIKSSQLYVSFDGEGKLTGVQSSEQ